MHTSPEDCPERRRGISRLLFPKVKTDRDLWETEGLPDPVDEVALVGKVDGRRIPDEQGEGRRFDCDLRDVVEEVRPAPAAGRRICLDDFPDLLIELTRLDASCVLGIHPIDQFEDL